MNFPRHGFFTIRLKRETVPHRIVAVKCQNTETYFFIKDYETLEKNP